MTEQTQSEAVPVDFNLDDWIDGGTVTQRSVDIYARPDLMAEYEDWERRYKPAEARAKQVGDEAGLDDGDELATLLAEGERIYSEWMASKTTWYVRALSDEEINEINERTPKFDALPEFAEKPPAEPRDRKGNPGAAYTVALEAYEARKAAFLEEQEPARAKLREQRSEAADAANLEMVAAAVVKIEAANGSVKHDVTVPQLVRLGERMGKVQLAKLLDAATIAKLKEPEIKPDFSLGTSKRDPA